MALRKNEQELNPYLPSHVEIKELVGSFVYHLDTILLVTSQHGTNLLIPVPGDTYTRNSHNYSNAIDVLKAG